MTPTGRFSVAALAAVSTLAAQPAAAELPEHPAVELREVPAWVDPVPIDPAAAPQAEPGVPARLLLFDRQILLPASGPSVSYIHIVYRIDHRTALEDWGDWEWAFDPSYQTVGVHHLEVWRDGAWHDRLASSRIALLQRERDLDLRMYDQRLDLVAVLDDLGTGDVVSLAYSLTGDNPVLGGRYSSSFTTVSGLPVERASLRLLTAPGRRLETRMIGDGPPAEWQRREDGWRELRWVFADGSQAAEDDDEASPVEQPVLWFTEVRSWAEVDRWALELYDPGPAPPELVELAAEIAAEAGDDPGARFAAARGWVQGRVRYFAVLAGIHSHTPHPPAETLARRYGDCKDKAMLLVALLGELGIDAWPALVNSTDGGDLAELPPTPAVFDHVIVVASVGDQTVWVDPTMSLQAGGADDACLPSYGWALEVRPGIEALTPVPETATHPGTTRVTYDYTLSRDEPAWASVTSVYERCEAESMRDYFSRSTPDEVLDGYSDFYSGAGVVAEPATDLEIRDDREANRLTVVERYRLRREEDGDDGGMLFETLTLLAEGKLVRPEDDRESALFLEHPMRLEETVMIHANGWGLELEPVDERVESRWFRLTAKSSPLPEGPGGIVIRYVLESLADEVAVADLDDYEDAVDEAYDALGYSVFVEGPGGPPARVWLPVAILVGLVLAGLVSLAVLLAGGLFLFFALRRL